MLINKVFCFKF